MAPHSDIPPPFAKVHDHRARLDILRSPCTLAHGPDYAQQPAARTIDDRRRPTDVRRLLDPNSLPPTNQDRAADQSALMKTFWKEPAHFWHYKRRRFRPFRNAEDRAEDFMATKAEATVDEIIGDLRLTFENELTGQLREKQFNKCRQGRGEPNEATMYNRVRTLTSQAFRAEDRATIEKKTRDAFLDGLEDETRYNVKDTNPRTAVQHSTKRS
uniref:Uncharacterized protein n=1 Tax=Caenorhabditis japonica TaxID=281687 RepID=A0A8R1IFH5_CAEJA